MTEINSELDAAHARLKAKKQPILTAYVVLKMIEQPGRSDQTAWFVLGQGLAGTQKAAIDEVAGDEGGIYRAVALGSWKGAEKREQVTKMASLPFEGV